MDIAADCRSAPCGLQVRFLPSACGRCGVLVARRAVTALERVQSPPSPL